MDKPLPISNKKKYYFLGKVDVLLALIFSIAFVYYPWFGKEFEDVINYLTRINDLVKYPEIMNGNKSSIQELLLSERVWDQLLLLVGTYFQDKLIGFKVLGVIALFNYTYFLRKYLPWGIILLFLLNPIFIDLINSQTRSALAFSIFLLISRVPNKYGQLALLLVCPFIHFSMYLLIFLVGVFWVLHKINWEKYIIPTAIIGALSFNLVYFLATNTSVIDKTMYQSSSLLYTSIWLIPIGINAKNYHSKNTLDFPPLYFFILIFYSTVFLFSPFFNLYGSRFFALVFPLLLTMTYGLPKNLRKVVFTLIFINQIIQFYYWIFK